MKEIEKILLQFWKERDILNTQLNNGTVFENNILINDLYHKYAILIRDICLEKYSKK